MKSILKSLTLGAVLAALVVPTFAAQAKVGAAAPDFTLTDLDGQTHQLSDLKGRTVVLEWVNPECPFVVRHYRTGNMPNLQKSATQDGVVWLTINSGAAGQQGDYDPAEAREWLEKNDAAPTAYLRDQDGKVGRMYEAKTTPHMFVINPDGTLIYDGAIDSSPRGASDAENYVLPALAAAKSGGMPDRQTSEPYGCNVKY